MSGVIMDGADGKETDMDGPPDSTRVLFNVGGTLHETFLSTLRHFPQSRLCLLATDASPTHTGPGPGRDCDKDIRKVELFLDRDPRLFAVILNFYRTGELHIPNDVCGPAMKKELDYWGVEELDMEPCCWMNYSTFADTSATLEEFEKDQLDAESPLCKVFSNNNLTWRLRLFRFLEDPYSSPKARLYAWLILSVVFLSILVYCLETVPELQTMNNEDIGNSTMSLLHADYKLFHGNYEGFYALVLVDNICNTIFLIEFMVRLAVAPNRCRFLKAPLNVIEILCIVPYYIAIILTATSSNVEKYKAVLEVLFLSRILRILRIFALMKHFQALKILVYTLRASTRELLLLVLILSLGMLLFAALLFQVENSSDDPESFKHIFDAIWWALITMTTVGYGDKVPKTSWGFVVGSLCATSGILVIALTVPIIVNNFTLYYSHAQAKKKLQDRRAERQGHCFLVPSHQVSSSTLFRQSQNTLRDRQQTLSFNRIRLESLEEEMNQSQQNHEGSVTSFPLASSTENLMKTSEYRLGRTRSSAKIVPQDID